MQQPTTRRQQVGLRSQCRSSNGRSAVPESRSNRSRIVLVTTAPYTDGLRRVIRRSDNQDQSVSVIRITIRFTAETHLRVPRPDSWRSRTFHRHPTQQLFVLSCFNKQTNTQRLKWFCGAGGSPDEARLEQTPHPFKPH